MCAWAGRRELYAAKLNKLLKLMISQNHYQALWSKRYIEAFEHHLLRWNITRSLRMIVERSYLIRHNDWECCNLHLSNHEQLIRWRPPWLRTWPAQWTGQFAPEIFKTCLVVRYNSKLQSFWPPPKTSAGCGHRLSTAQHAVKRMRKNGAQFDHCENRKHSDIYCTTKDFAFLAELQSHLHSKSKLSREQE